MSQCELFQKGACLECAEYPHFGCPELRTAFEAGKKDALGRLSSVRILPVTGDYGNLYAVWNGEIVSEKDVQKAILLYPLHDDPRIMFVRQNTWNVVFGEPPQQPEEASGDPYRHVKIANEVFYYGPESTVPVSGTIVEIVRPSASCKDGKITIKIQNRIIYAKFSDIGKTLFFSEAEIYARKE